MVKIRISNKIDTNILTFSELQRWNALAFTCVIKQKTPVVNTNIDIHWLCLINSLFYNCWKFPSF